MRWDYGFTEFYSSVYYKENIGALINLIDYAVEEEVVIKSQIILDLLFFDIATQSTHKMFISTSGRAYERNRKGGELATFNGLIEYLWGNGPEIGPGMMFGLMVSDKYTVPPVFNAIANDSAIAIIKQRNGLDIADLKHEGYRGTDMNSLMMQWGMEAFVNPKVVRNSLTHIRNYNMFSNAFLNDFKRMDIAFLKWFHLEPIAMRIVTPQYAGTAIQQGHTYTYSTKDYSIYTVQNHHPGTFADQQHVFGMNIKNHFAIFHTHPAAEQEINTASPNYWVGYGHFPHAVQDERVNLSIYKLPSKKGLMEKDLLHYTHAYFPK